jgi:hypothetical protein
MKSTLLTFPLLAPLIFGACTSVKTDDHSYTYVYQHNAQPAREVTETVTTKTTRTRYNQPRDVEPDPGAAEERTQGASDGEIIENMRSDPFPTGRSKGFSYQPPEPVPHAGLPVPAASASFDDPYYGRGYQPVVYNPYDNAYPGVSRGFVTTSPRVVSVPDPGFYSASVQLWSCPQPPRCDSGFRVPSQNRRPSPVAPIACRGAVQPFLPFQPFATDPRFSSGFAGSSCRPPAGGGCPPSVSRTGRGSSVSGTMLACVSRRDGR